MSAFLIITELIIIITILLVHRSEKKETEKKHHDKVEELIISSKAHANECIRIALSEYKASAYHITEGNPPNPDERLYETSDCIHLSGPVDFIVFKNLTKNILNGDKMGSIEVIFVNLNSDKSHVSDSEMMIQEAIRHGRVKFEAIYYDHFDRISAG